MIGDGQRPRKIARFRVAALILLECIAIWLIFDFVYSSLIAEHKRPPRIANSIFHHALAPNYDGFDIWAEHKSRLHTNNLGFKDAAVREVPLVPSTRRIVLIGDSFTEGIGLPFEDTFAGMLYAAGQASTPKIEFLNAAVASYSPTIYWKKIKYYLEQGLQFDELIVLPDMSDVSDEASRYFCVDENPAYHRYCTDDGEQYPEERASGFRPFLQTRFLITDDARLLIKGLLHAWMHPGKNPKLEHSPLDSWSVPGLVRQLHSERYFAPAWS